MKAKVLYGTNYAKPLVKNGFVIAEDHGDYLFINKRQYNNCYKNLTIGGVCPLFDCDKPLYVMDDNSICFECAKGCVK